MMRNLYHPIIVAMLESAGLIEENSGDAVSVLSNHPAIRRSRPKGSQATWLDDALDIRNPEGETLQSTVSAVMSQPSGRGRRMNPLRLQRLLRVVLANGLRCHFYRDPPSVLHPRQAGKRAKGSEQFTGKQLSKITNQLAEAGLVSLTLGRRRIASRYAATEKLVQLAGQAGISERSLLIRVPPADLVRLFVSKPKRLKGKRQKKRTQMEFIPTTQTLEWKAQLQAINAFFAAHHIDIDLPLSDKLKWAQHSTKDKERSGAPFRQPELIQTDLYRVFNNASFEQGGRMYGGWWINCPSNLRPKITIDGMPTVELDYSGCHINMLYHERGLECDGDPYELPELKQYQQSIGLEPRVFRSCIKQYTQALINSSKGGKPSRIELKEGTLTPSIFSPLQLVRMIEQKHEPIGDAFRSNSGLRLQRKDSDMAMEIMTIAMSEGWVALPIHDSFIATTDNEDRLRFLMKDAYFSRFCYDINITNE